METNLPWCCEKTMNSGWKPPSYKMIGNPIRLLRVAWDSTKLAVQVIAKNKQRAVVVSENQQAVAKQYRSDSNFTKCLNVEYIWQIICPVRKWALTLLCKMSPTSSINITVVSYQNESCLLALSFLHNSREDGGKIGSSHFDETLSIGWRHCRLWLCFHVSLSTA